MGNGQGIGKISWTRDSDNNLAFNPQYNSCNRALIHRMRNSGGGSGQENENFFRFVKSPKPVNLLKVVNNWIFRLPWVWKARTDPVLWGTYYRFSEILRRQTSTAGFWRHLMVAGYSWHPPFEIIHVFTRLLNWIFFPQSWYKMITRWYCNIC